MTRFKDIAYCILILLPSGLAAQSIVNTPHNLSVSGTGDIKALSESEICIFCHTPHDSKARSPLWNRRDPGATYTLYNHSVSSTLQAEPGQPDGASLLCLSCHDGTIALGNVLSRPTEISFSRGSVRLANQSSNLGKDLSNDHPVSFHYGSSLSAVDPQLRDPSLLTGPVKLSQGKMQCTSCHDPHKNLTHDFLVATNEYSVLCRHCHQVNDWETSSHRLSNATWDGRGPNPWSHNPDSYNSVTKNACGNCHRPHHAGGRAQLMNFLAEENNCLNCHDGTVSETGKNLRKEFSKTYRHDVMSYTGLHDAGEPAIPGIKHVECVDCHNPHASGPANAVAPVVRGSLTGVRGVNINGLAVERAQYEYEICFRCHSASPVTGPATKRQVVQADNRLEFLPGGISFHPVASVGKNDYVPGLLAPYTESSMIYCSDCHAGNGNDAPAGPHGSIYPQILKYQYSKSENIPESASAYALCYSCHARSEYVQDAGDNVKRLVHFKHVVEVKTSCNTCHDPHGIGSAQGLPGRHTHLINFNTSVVSPLNGQLYFQDDGKRMGRCYLTCHNKVHDGLRY